jgi:hypothetical protein
MTPRMFPPPPRPPLFSDYQMIGAILVGLAMVAIAALAEGF